MDQRTCIKFSVKNEIKCADAFRMLTVAYGEATLDQSNVYRWYKMFSEGRENVNDEECAGRPSTSTTDEKINEVENMILANRRITVREVAEDLNISIGSCHSIFINDLGMRRVAVKFVPKLLNCDQKQHRMNITNEMLDSVRDDPNLLQRVITGDEAWVYGYDMETKAQSSQWKLPHEPRQKKARQVRLNVKVLLTVFFDCRRVVHHEFLPQGRTVNKEYYLQVMRNLREAIRQKRPDLWKNKNWLLHHDNAPAHTSMLVRDFLAKNNTLMMPQPLYPPDLAPCDFFLLPKLKRPMKGRRYATLDEIKTASKEELKKIFKNHFLKCFEDWKNRWHKCIISHGDYFEGDKIVLLFKCGNKLIVARCAQSFMTAGDLLNKSHEELVLLLISLRRQQASLEREMEAEQEGSNHWRLLDSRHKAGESLVSLVDSMVKLGTLYDGTATPLNDPKPPSSSPPLPPWPDLELPEAELAQTSQFYQEKLEEFARIDQSIQEELRIFSSFEKERAVLEQLLDSPLSGPQRQQFQREIDELESRLAACRRRVMLLVEEDQSLGQELSMLRSHLLNICSPTQETKIEKMLQELAQRKHALAQAHREVRASPTGLAGAHPLPPGKRKPNTYLETDLDSMVSRDLATGADVAATADTQALYENAPPQPVEELSYMQDISEADDKVKRFYGIIPREKPAEVKTVRIVKRESERRNRGKKEISWQDMEDAKDSKDIVVKQRMRRRRHNTVVGIPELPTQPPSPARARDDTDLALCLKTVNTPDIVRSTIKKSPFVFDDKLIDQVLGLPQKISIPERYVEVEETEPLSASEKLKRTLKAENIKKMLTSTSVEAVPDREQGRKLLTLNHTLAREVVERSKMVAAHTSPPSTQQLPKC
ncbi:hypothetical protein LAZ67_18000172 [Cordylochernes scorpioides]|uniref:Mos1 transposase HTH domain-containing protein n=1 Tax=Cordylochernes scorpioides TaxID=51811 RepID=A0ABY6LEN1_9ARAC|nr:hypothetical protein LAZ67_18000172 [Cordylochernes scorpioides]